MTIITPTTCDPVPAIPHMFTGLLVTGFTIVVGPFTSMIAPFDAVTADDWPRYTSALDSLLDKIIVPPGGIVPRNVAGLVGTVYCVMLIATPGHLPPSRAASDARTDADARLTAQAP